MQVLLSIYLEYAHVTITMKSKRRIVLVCVYRKQEISFASFYEEFSSFMEKIVFKGDAALIVGDFNVWVDIEDDKNATSLGTLMNAYGLNQLVQEPTHRSGHTLDQIYVNEFQGDIEHQVINDTLGLTTDHFPLLIELPSTNVQQTTRTIEYRKLKDVDLNAFKHDLQESYQLIENSGTESFATMFGQYDELSRTVLNKHAPIVKRICRTTEPPWMDIEYKKSRAKRRKY